MTTTKKFWRSNQRRTCSTGSPVTEFRRRDQISSLCKISGPHRIRGRIIARKQFLCFKISLVCSDVYDVSSNNLLLLARFLIWGPCNLSETGNFIPVHHTASGDEEHLLSGFRSLKTRLRNCQAPALGPVFQVNSRTCEASSHPWQHPSAPYDYSWSPGLYDSAPGTAEGCLSFCIALWQMKTLSWFYAPSNCSTSFLYVVLPDSSSRRPVQLHTLWLSDWQGWILGKVTWLVCSPLLDTDLVVWTPICLTNLYIYDVYNITITWVVPWFQARLLLILISAAEAVNILDLPKPVHSGPPHARFDRCLSQLQKCGMFKEIAVTSRLLDTHEKTLLLDLWWAEAQMWLSTIHVYVLKGLF